MNAYVKKRLHVVLALLLCLSLAILPCAAHAAGQVDGNLQIVFLDVGAGRCRPGVQRRADNAD